MQQAYNDDQYEAAVCARLHAHGHKPRVGPPGHFPLLVFASKTKTSWRRGRTVHAILSLRLRRPELPLTGERAAEEAMHAFLWKAGRPPA